MKAFLKALTVFTALVLATPSIAADKGGMPPSKVNAVGEVQNFKGCHLGLSGGGSFMSTAFDSFSTGLVGLEAGCDLQKGRILFGVRGGYDFGESSSRFAHVGGRVGMLINESAVVYGLMILTMDGRSPKMDDSILSGGIGLEVMAFTPRTSIFIESSKDLKAFGDARDVSDAWLFRFGGRYRW